MTAACASRTSLPRITSTALSPFCAKALIDVREVHRQKCARSRLDLAEHEHRIRELVNIQVRAAGTSPFHLKLIERQPHLTHQNKADDRAGSAGIDEDDDGTTVQRASGVEMSNSAPGKMDLLVIGLDQKTCQCHSGDDARRLTKTRSANAGESARGGEVGVMRILVVRRPAVGCIAQLGLDAQSLGVLLALLWRSVICGDFSGADFNRAILAHEGCNIFIALALFPQ